MVRIPLHRFQIRLGETLENFFVGGSRLETVACAVPHPTQRRFQLDEQAEPVALVEKFLGRRIVRSADEVAVALAENLGVLLP